MASTPEHPRSLSTDSKQTISLCPEGMFSCCLLQRHSEKLEKKCLLLLPYPIIFLLNTNSALAAPASTYEYPPVASVVEMVPEGL